MHLVSSSYNIPFRAEDGEFLLFNTVSGGFAHIGDYSVDAVQEFLLDPNRTPASSTERELLDVLREGGFIISSENDETSILRMRNVLGRYTAKSLAYTIMPTFSCNFRCAYCFERQREVDMSPDVEARVLAWMDEQLPYNHSISVAWYGGEPLLRFDIVERMSRHLIDSCRKLSRPVSLNMTTNGSLLYPDIVDSIIEMKFDFVQVTIDGPKAVHDKRRPFADGSGSFSAILENSLRAAEKLRMLAIRVNVDFDNLDDAYLLLDDLGSYDVLKQPRVNLHFEGVAPLSSFCSDYARQFSMPATSKAIIDLAREASRKGFSVETGNTMQMRHCSYCAAECFNQYVIGPEGELYKCSSVLEPEDSVGRISEQGKAMLNMHMLAPWLTRNPFESDECRPCKFLPICMGGCMLRKIRSGSENMCPPVKYNTLAVLNAAYIERKAAAGADRSRSSHAKGGGE